MSNQRPTSPAFMQASGSPTLPTRPLLVGLYHVVPMGSDRVQIANGGRMVVLSGPDLAMQVTPVLAALDGSRTTTELQELFPEVARDLLVGLHAKGLLTDADADCGSGRRGPATQLTSFSLPASPSAADTARLLSQSNVMIAGCGPVGSEVAVLLVKAGIGHLALWDPQPATARDVAVSSVLTFAQEGMPRSEAARVICLASTSAPVDIVVHAEADEALATSDLVVLEFREEVGLPIANLCLATGVPYLLHGQDALESRVGPLVSNGGSPCHHCLDARCLSHVAHLDEHLAYRRVRATTSPQPDAFLAAQSAIVAGAVALEVLKGLLDASPLTHGAILVIDVGALDLRQEVLHAVPGCQGCLTASPRTEGECRARE